MADNTIMLNVREGFDLKKLTEQLAEMYRAKGFSMNATSFNDSEMLVFDKGIGGINMLLGMDLGIKATFTIQNEKTLIVTFSDAAWTGKIIGLCVGWVVCAVPFFTAIYGAVKQSQFPKDLQNDITMLASQQ